MTSQDGPRPAVDSTLLHQAGLSSPYELYTQQQLVDEIGASCRQNKMLGFAALTPTYCTGSEPDPVFDRATGPRRKRGPAPKIQQQLEQVAALPKAKQRAIAQVLDSMLAHSSG